MTTTEPGTRRIDRGRGHSYLLDGQPADGITKIIGQGVPKPALVDWAARTSAGYAVDNWAELDQLKPSERLRRIEKARFETLRQAAARGTDVHALALKLAAGETIDVPDHLEGHVDAYLAFVNDWKARELVTEAVVGNRQYRYMGTLDTIAELADRKVWLLDWKTGASGIWPESALQLAAYRHCEFYIDNDRDEQPMPAVDRCGCVWLRADGYDLIPVNAGPQTFRAFLHAQQVAHYCDLQRETLIGNAERPPQ